MKAKMLRGRRVFAIMVILSLCLAMVLNQKTYAASRYNDCRNISSKKGWVKIYDNTDKKAHYERITTTQSLDVKMTLTGGGEWSENNAVKVKYGSGTRDFYVGKNVKAVYVRVRKAWIFDLTAMVMWDKIS
jgi:hypothetical protein